MKTISMKVHEWIAVEDNPIQRDTERHAAKAKHLLTPLPTHYFVFAAELPGGSLIKLDGHTRALMWKRGDIPYPLDGKVTVGIVPVKTRAEAEALYKTFDSKDALETIRDKVSGAFNRFGFEPKSALLQSGNVVQGLRCAYGVFIGGTVKTGFAGGNKDQATSKDRRTEKQLEASTADVYKMISEFSYELNALDGFGLRQGQITSGILGAFLLSYRKYGHKITPFWTAVFGNQGSKIGGQMDGVQAVCEMILARKHQKGALSKTGVADMASRCLNAVDKWLKDELFYSIPRPIDTAGYLEGHKQAPERLIKRADLKEVRKA